MPRRREFEYFSHVLVLRDVLGGDLLLSSPLSAENIKTVLKKGSAARLFPNQAPTETMVAAASEMDRR